MSEDNDLSGDKNAKYQPSTTKYRDVTYIQWQPKYIYQHISKQVHFILD
jgi:hypothetical protein